MRVPTIILLAAAACAGCAQGGDPFAETKANAARAQLEIAELDKAAAAECKRKGAARVGMTAAEVTASCAGQPNEVNRWETAGDTLEAWTMKNGSIIYFTNWKVTTIQTSSAR